MRCRSLSAARNATEFPLLRVRWPGMIPLWRRPSSGRSAGASGASSASAARRGCSSWSAAWRAALGATRDGVPGRVLVRPSPDASGSGGAGGRPAQSGAECRTRRVGRVVASLDARPGPSAPGAHRHDGVVCRGCAPGAAAGAGRAHSADRRGGARALARCFQEAKIPRGRRGGWPVLESDGLAVWVPGVCRADALLPEPGAEALRVDVTNR